MTKTRVTAQILTPTGRIISREINFVSAGTVRPSDGQLLYSFARHVGAQAQDVRLVSINFL